MSETNYEFINTDSVPIKAWTKGIQIEPSALQQLFAIASMRNVLFRHIAVMPDVHWGKGATVGSVIATERAIIPAAVGVDIGCGMIAQRTTLRAENLPDSLSMLRADIEKRIPHGRTNNGGQGDRGAWGEAPDDVVSAFTRKDIFSNGSLADRLAQIVVKHPKLARARNITHLCTLGTGNHFIEICLDEQGRVWVMLHSGSRGIGNSIGQLFIELAKKDMEQWLINLPDADLAYLPEGSAHFKDYVEAVDWAQDFAMQNRAVMMERVLAAMRECLPPFELEEKVVNCHHNYVTRENHFGKDVWITRKGAVRARVEDLGIIPGSMGDRSYIVRGKGNPDSFQSSSHGAGRRMSRTEARKRFSIEDHKAAMQGIEARLDEGVLDETPGAYKDIDAVMAAQSDLVEVVHTLRQVVNIKG